jgi:molecular chaperone GrpE (heat shock protein)
MSDENQDTKAPAPGTDGDSAETPKPETLSGEELAALRDRAAKADEYLELARRAKADFINYQDRVRRDKADWHRQALDGFIRELLPALDGMALAKFDDPKLVEAIRVVEKEFLRVLAKSAILPIETAGKSFDPAFHEAVGIEPGGTVLEEVRRGWMFGEKVLRPASVRIVKAKP